MGWGGEEEGGVCTVLSWEAAVGGAWSHGHPPPGSHGPTAADAPGALNALENTNLNTCQEIGWGGAGGGFARCFSLLFGGSPFASIYGIQHELGAGGRGYPEISLYPEMGPATPLPFGVLLPVGGRVIGTSPHRGGLKHKVQFVLPNPLGNAPKPPPGTAAASPLH